MTKTAAQSKCMDCCRPATHYRRYDMVWANRGIVTESYRPTCDACAAISANLTSAPRIPLSEVI